MTKTAPAFVTMTDASKLANVSRRTIDRDILNGEIHESQIKKEKNRRKISVAELERVYGKLERETETERAECPTLSKTDQDILGIIQKQLEEEKDRVRKAEEEAKAWQDRYLTAQERLNGFLLPAPKAEEKKGFFSRLFG